MDPLLFKFLHDHRSVELQAERHHHTLAQLAAANRPEGAQRPLQQWITRLLAVLRPAPAAGTSPAATTVKAARTGLTARATAALSPVIGRPMGCVR